MLERTHSLGEADPHQQNAVRHVLHRDIETRSVLSLRDVGFTDTSYTRRLRCSVSVSPSTTAQCNRACQAIAAITEKNFKEFLHEQEESPEIPAK
jgi:hypothetical protein